MSRRRSNPFAPLAAAIALLSLVGLAGHAEAQGLVDRANALYDSIDEEDRSDLILLPHVARMDPPPPVIDGPVQAMLLPAGAGGWDEAEAWATAEPQRAVLKAIHEVGTEWDPIRGKAFGLPYGVAAVAEMPAGLELIQAGLYVELGEPPLLADAQFLYLDGLDDVASLVNVEATRLAAAGDPFAALQLLMDYTYFGWQMARREMFVEARWGYRSMIATMTRLRDVAYTDWRSESPSLTAHNVIDLLRRAETGRDLRFDLLDFPEGDHIAMTQILAIVFDESGRLDEETFGPTMARLSSRGRSLRLFSEVSWWEKAADIQADGEEMKEKAAGVWRDWAENRWRREAFDPKLKTPSTFERLTGEFATVRTVYTHRMRDGEVSPQILLHERQRLLTEAAGTRTALALMGYHNATGRFPPSVFAIRPQFVKRVDDDPYNPEPMAPLQYFVPWKVNYREPASREETPPHSVRIILEDGANFLRRIGSDQFVLYSVGPNTADDRAVNIENSSRANAGDYLIWPPVLSLLRQNMTEQGLFN